MQIHSPPIDYSLWWEFVIKPRKTLHKIIRAKSRLQLLILAMLFGISFTMSQLLPRTVGNSSELQAAFIVGLLTGPFIGIVTVYFISVFLYETGSWLGGQAPVEHLRVIYAWSLIPNLLTLLLSLIKPFLFINAFFTFVIPLVVNFWSFILLLVGISEVQQFSFWRTLGSLVLSFLILGVLCIVILLLLLGFGLLPNSH